MFDVIVVGARCAGSPTAMLLARNGHRVLLVDRASFPSDKPTSTHLVHPPGVARLRDWGLLDQLVASNCPPIRDYGLKTGPVDLMAPLPGYDGIDVAYAPRRYVLDEILVRAAVQAGVELREQVSVTGLLRDGDRVVGITGKTHDGASFSEHASLVVGADGTNSRVARLVGAKEYRTRRPYLSSFWTYWDGMDVTQVPSWRDEQSYGFAWPTNDGLVLCGVAWPTADFTRLDRSDPSVPFFSALSRMDPAFAEKAHDARQADRWLSGSVPNFFRESHGPGWALVGDASYSRDPCTATGITESLRGADLLAEEVDRALSGEVSMTRALTSYEVRRNAISLPYYEYTCDFASLRPYPPDVLQLMAAAADDPEQASALTGLFAQTTAPEQFFSIENIGRILSGPQRDRITDWRLRSVRAVLSDRLPMAAARSRMAGPMVRSRLGQFGDYLTAVAV